MKVKKEWAEAGIALLLLAMFLPSTFSVSLSACGNLTNSSSPYTLTQDINASGTCLFILANNVTVLGNGFLINYSQGVKGLGVNNTLGYNNTIIRNLTLIQGSSVADSSAIYFVNVTNASIEDVNISTQGSSSYGVFLTDGERNNVTRAVISTAGDDSYGVFLGFGSRLGSFPSLTILTSGARSYGIYAESSSVRNTFISPSVSVSGADAYGIYLTASSSNNSVSGGSVVSSLSSALVLLSDTLYTNLTNVSLSSPSTAYDIYLENGGNNFTSLTDMAVGNYSFTSPGSIVHVKDSRYGEVRFLEAVNATGNLTLDIRIANNSASVNSGEHPGLNRSADIFLFGIDISDISSPAILRNGVTRCEAASSPRCVNATSLFANPVRFNVTAWTNYSIGQDPNVFSCGVLDSPDTVYELQVDALSAGTCFTVAANNITLEGFGSVINYSRSGGGVAFNLSSYNDTTLRNLTIVQGSASASSPAIVGDGGTTITLEQVTITTSGAASGPVSITGAGEVRIRNASITSSGQGSAGIFLSSVSGGEIKDSNITIGGSSSYALQLVSSSGLGISGGRMNASRSVLLFNRSGSNNISDMVLVNTSEHGVLSLSSNSNRFERVSVLFAALTGFNLSSSNSTAFINNTFGSVAEEYVFPGTLIGEYALNGTSLDIENARGRVAFTNTSLFASGSNLSDDIRIEENLIVINTTRSPGLNTSANLTLKGLSFSDPLIEVDENLDGTFSACSDCTELSYVSGTLLFNVSHFSAYRASETPVTSSSSGGGGGGTSVSGGWPFPGWQGSGEESGAEKGGEEAGLPDEPAAPAPERGEEERGEKIPGNETPADSPGTEDAKDSKTALIIGIVFLAALLGVLFWQRPVRAWK